MAGNNQINMEEVSQYYDHYKDTFELQKGYITKRDRLTLVLLVAAAMLIGLIFDPATFSEKINTAIKANVEDLTFDIQFINTALLLITFWCLLQYYMVVLQIEKMYTYIDECEKKLTAATPHYPINREGAYYLKSYPWLKEIADYIFVLGLPLGFITLCIAKIVNEQDWTTYLRYVDFVILSLIIIFSFLYISNRKLKEEYYDKKRYNIKCYQRLLGYFRFKTYKEEPDEPTCK